MRLLKRSGDRPYTLRFTVDQGPKFVGKRVSLTLDTKDLPLAAKVAGLVVETLRKADFLLENVKFVQPSEDYNNMALHDCISAIIQDLTGQDDEMAELLQEAVDSAS